MPMTVLGYTVAAIVGYLLGCSNMAYYISRWKKLTFGTAAAAT